MAKAVDKAYQTVRERIVRGVYPASSRITEQEVAAAAGVSRTPVREALRKLHAEGLLEFIPHQGAVVTEWTSEDRDDVFELRALLESYGAARAARRMSEAGIAELRQLAEDQYHETIAKAPGYLLRIGDLNSQFHRRIHEFAGSGRLVSALASLIEAPLMMKTFESYQNEDLVRSAAHHLEIVRALEARDGDWSAALMRSHILGARGALRVL
jgi:DNA-binding GntR family transcriptional regulator